MEYLGDQENSSQDHQNPSSGPFAGYHHQSDDDQHHWPGKKNPAQMFKNGKKRLEQLIDVEMNAYLLQQPEGSYGNQYDRQYQFGPVVPMLAF